jgi:2-aminoethylphosphonate-pyruvate transaminase
MILLNPGPVNLTESVRQALRGPDLCHREPEFADLQASIRQALLDVYGLSHDEWAAVVLAGSGTAAVEAMLTSLMPRNGTLLVIENGVYGERMTAIAKVHEIAYKTLTYAWGARLNIRQIRTALKLNPNITHVGVVHHETTTGRLNELAELGDLCREYGAYLLVDAVSSFGAEALDLDGYPIAACAATSNKCLHGAPGVSFVIVRRDRLAAAESVQRSLYLDLARYCREQDKRTTPFTQSVQIFYALRQALSELADQGGWRARHEKYRAMAVKIRASLLRLSIEPMLDEGETSVVLSAYYLPNDLSYETLHDALKARGFVIYAGQGELARRIFRLSVMGAITGDDIERLIEGFVAIMRAA